MTRFELLLLVCVVVLGSVLYQGKEVPAVDTPVCRSDDHSFPSLSVHYKTKQKMIQFYHNFNQATYLLIEVC